MELELSFIPTAHGLFRWRQRCPSVSPQVSIQSRVPPRAATRGSSNSRRQKPQRRRTPKPDKDPILDDGDVDTTDVNTFVSCNVCFNSLVVPPIKFLPSGTVVLNCNVCETKIRASINDLELISGDKFPAAAFMAKAAMQADENTT